jgi:hypothetical protein
MNFSNWLNISQGDHSSNLSGIIFSSSKINFILASFGIIGNILCIIVFSNKKMVIRKFNWYLLILAIIELIYCLIIFIDYLSRILYSSPMMLHDLNIHVNVLIDFLIHMIDSFTTLITIILSTDRLYAIRNPIKIKQFFTNVHKKLLTFVSFSLLILLKIPCLKVIFLNIKLFKADFYIIYCTILFPIVFNIVPTIIIFVLNSILVCEIVKYYNHIPNIDLLDQRGSLSCNEQINNSVKRSISSNNQKSISKTQRSHYFIIVAVSVWTVLTTMPYYLLNTYLLLLRIDLFENHFESDAITIAQIISSVFFNSNHCINFLIYLFFYAHFKGLLCKIFSKSSLKRISTYKNVENKELFDCT